MVMYIRDYRESDAEALMRLFYDTVHHVNAAHYTAQQIDAWAPTDGMDVVQWRARFTEKRPYVAVVGDAPVGFAELESDGHIDALYVHHERQRQGIGTLLLEAILAAARAHDMPWLVAAVSITARPFFERHGFAVVAAQDVQVRGETLHNYIMEMPLRRG